MISDEQYEQLTLKSRQPKSLVQFFRESPLAGVEHSILGTRQKTADVTLEISGAGIYSIPIWYPSLSRPQPRVARCGMGGCRR